jgi:hypothetical protein
MVMNKLKLGAGSVAAAVLLTAGSVGAAPANGNNGNSNAGNDVTYCHATASQSNPYVRITTNSNGVVNGHQNHQNGNDIIPPFSYNSHGTFKSFPGLNWDAQGQAIFNNDCKQPAGGLGGGTLTNTQMQSQLAGGQGGGQIGTGETATPQGAVNAGFGGVKTFSLAGFLGMGGSIASLAGGLLWSNKRKLF